MLKDGNKAFAAKELDKEFGSCGAYAGSRVIVMLQMRQTIMGQLVGKLAASGSYGG